MIGQSEIGVMRGSRYFFLNLKTNKHVLTFGVFVFVLASCGYQPDEKPISIVEHDIKTLEIALNNYKIHYGNFPSPESNSCFLNNRKLIFELMGSKPPKSADQALTNADRKVFLGPPSSRVINGEFLDEWGKPYIFAIRTNSRSKIDLGWIQVDEDLVLWSCGPNGQNEFGRGDDVASWLQKGK